MKLVVCEKCEAEFSIKHSMSDRHYIISHCTFCGSELSSDLEDEIMDWDEDD